MSVMTRGRCIRMAASREELCGFRGLAYNSDNANPQRAKTDAGPV